MDLAQYALLTEGFMTVKAAIAFTGLSKRTLFTLMENGELHYVQKPGHRIRLIPKRALIQWAADGLKGGDVKRR